MAVGGRTTNTFPEILQNILRDLSVAKTLPDTDLQFAVDLETQIVSKLREPIDNAANSSPPGMGPSGPAPAPVPPPPMAPPGMPPPPPGPPPGMGAPPDLGAPVPAGAGAPPVPGGGPPGLRAQPPSPDEMARLLGGGGPGA